MRDVVTIDIDAPLEDVARLFTDPRVSESWMKETRYEPLSGDQGSSGSKYRLVTKQMTFMATVIASDLPHASEILLEAPNVSVRVNGSFAALTPAKTRLTSEELFTFKGLAGKAMSLLARRAIRKAHRDQMESFRRFAESRIRR